MNVYRDPQPPLWAPNAWEWTPAPKRPANNPDERGFIYVVYLPTPLARGLPGDKRFAQTYTGWALDPRQRFHEHLNGRGAAMLKAAAERGLPMILFVIGPGTRTDERTFKNRRHAVRELTRLGYLPLDPKNLTSPPDSWYGDVSSQQLF